MSHCVTPHHYFCCLHVQLDVRRENKESVRCHGQKEQRSAPSPGTQSHRLAGLLLLLRLAGPAAPLLPPTEVVVGGGLTKAKSALSGLSMSVSSASHASIAALASSNCSYSRSAYPWRIRRMSNGSKKGKRCDSPLRSQSAYPSSNGNSLLVQNRQTYPPLPLLLPLHQCWSRSQSIPRQLQPNVGERVPLFSRAIVPCEPTNPFLITHNEQLSPLWTPRLCCLHQAGQRMHCLQRRPRLDHRSSD